MNKRVRNRTPVGSYEKQLVKYLPEFLKLFPITTDRIYHEEAIKRSGYTEWHTYKILAILKELGWINCTKKHNVTKQKVWFVSKYGKQMMEGKINASAGNSD